MSSCIGAVQAAEVPMERRRAPSWVLVNAVICVLVVFALIGQSQAHAGCNHDHEHDHTADDWTSQGFSSFDGDSHAHHMHSRDDHGHAHHHHSNQKGSHSHHDHGHSQKRGRDLSHGSSKKADRSKGWRPAEEMAEERELREFGFEPEIDDHDESDIELVGSIDVGLWLRAMGSSLAVSLASLICLMLIPFIPYGGGMPSRTFVDSLAAFGVGAMLGDAFLHQLPHAFGSGGHAHAHGAHDHEHGHGHEGHAHEHGATGAHGHSLADLAVGLSVLVGILLFFIVEKIVRSVEAESQKGKAVPFSGGHHHHHHGSKHKHGKGEAEEDEDKKEAVAVPEAKEEEKGGKGEEDSNGGEEKDEVEDGFVLASASKVEDGKKGGKGKAKGLKQRKTAGAGDAQSAAADVVVASGGDVAAGGGATTSPSAPAESAAEGEKKRRKKKKAKEEDAAGPEAETPAEGKAGSAAVAKSQKEKDSKAVKKVEGGAAMESQSKEQAGSSMMVLGYLNLFSDGVHNFTDGMSLGAAFLHHGSLGGYSRMLFMLAHELPQEVGDFGILLRAGFGVFRALAFNFLSALMAMAGTAFALLLGGNPGHSSIIEGFTAGGFIYIAVAGVMPDMHSSGTGLRVTLLQLFCMAAGMAVAVGISLME
eukprot:TRINITY_DN16389_c0_g1_i1.p1 TRINITY_DN16389_c0_g1~~TRINITY_DN16389_c0_g1_i1.p1  ORF type:complete len:646 (-),score=155.89 TRINITY_DN16389_c0_g1_i1:334-2271(-)